MRWRFLLLLMVTGGIIYGSLKHFQSVDLLPSFPPTTKKTTQEVVDPTTPTISVARNAPLARVRNAPLKRSANPVSVAQTGEFSAENSFPRFSPEQKSAVIEKKASSGETYLFKQPQFSVELPTDWDRTENTLSEGQKVYFIHPNARLRRQEVDPQFPENISILVQPLPENLNSLEAFSRDSWQQLESLPAFKRSQSAPWTDVQGQVWESANYQFQQPSGPLSITQQLWSVQQGKAYIITFSAAHLEDLKLYQPVLENLKATWNWAG